jgi:acyl-CoA synthetase (NDP forming)
VLTEHQSKLILAAYDIAVPEERLASDSDAAVAAARALGFPVALKLQSPDIPHKTEAGGVALGLAEAGAVGAAHDRIIAAAARSHPGARLAGVLVQPMAKPGLEMILGAVVDANFGPQLVVGLGGIAVEVLGDVAMAPAPLSREQAHRLVERLRGARLLAGLRGRPPRDSAALLHLLTRLSVLVVDLADRVAEIDLNPVLVHDVGDGVTIVDALIVQHEAQRTR